MASIRPEFSAGGGKGLGEAIGESEAFLEFQSRLSLAAKVERPVLIVGERGTGKELAVNRLHYLSPRWQGPLVTLNCAALAPSVLESELFGHEVGAFTGASRRRSGRFESASEGTLFLDEIGLIPLSVQEKILRVVEYGAFERVGSSESIHVDVRIVGATNADLQVLSETKQFKRDLLDRLSFDVLFLPPLRARQWDIMLLARHFATRMALELGRAEAPEFSEDAIGILQAHPWPGNIRELKNVVERAVYRSSGSKYKIAEIDFNPYRSPFSPLDSDPYASNSSPSLEDETYLENEPETTPSSGAVKVEIQSLPAQVRALELRNVRRALRESQFHQSSAARILGLTYHQFRGLYRKYRDEL